MSLSLTQMEAYDLEAGWPAQTVPEAAAIEEAESSGDPSAIGPSYGGDSGSWGLFQIQPYAHPDVQETTDPLQQSKDALQIYQAAGDSFSPWSTYPGAASQFLSQAQSDLAAAQQQSPGSSSSSSSSSGSDSSGLAGDVEDAWKNFSGALGSGLTQAGQGAEIFVGLLVIGGGIALLFSQTSIGKETIAKVKQAGKKAVEASVLA